MLRRRAEAVLLLIGAIFFVSDEAKSQTADSNRTVIDIIFSSAKRSCEILEAYNLHSTANLLPEVKSELASVAEQVAEKVPREVGQQLQSETYVRVFFDQLVAAILHKKACEVEAVQSLSTILMPRPSTQRVFVVTQESGWRGGGYSPNAWCQDYITMLRGKYPGGEFRRLNSGERKGNRCAPFNCPQYLYTCTVEVTLPI